MRKRSLAFAFGVSLFTFLILLTENYYDSLFLELTTTDLLIFTILSTLTGAIALFSLWLVLFAIKKGELSEKPQIYNVSGLLFLLFALILYLYMRDIPLRELKMPVLLAILVFYITPLVIGLFVLCRKLSLILTFGISLAVFLILLTATYYDKMFYEVKTIDLLYFSIWSTIAGGIGAGIYFLLTERLGDFNLSGAFILIFFGLLYMHTGNIELEDVIMATFISVLTLFSFILVSGLFVLIMIFNHYKKKSRWT